ncbi:hypothetical protein RRG08_014653 [Elysia crispata]|uniref:Uncharacterized protein n=1 Tax=Elysia crispata TaxID=231223 RepID=A0AAE1CZ19_9GAST|nr:hypothetical protein RRG08_014653 [Elysia crispata]
MKRSEQTANGPPSCRLHTGTPCFWSDDSALIKIYTDRSSAKYLTLEQGTNFVSLNNSENGNIRKSPSIRADMYRVLISTRGDKPVALARIRMRVTWFRAEQIAELPVSAMRVETEGGDRQFEGSLLPEIPGHLKALRGDGARRILDGGL